MKNIELYYMYFTRPEGTREVGDPLPTSQLQSEEAPDEQEATHQPEF
jgi:hypothetical protein